MCSTDTLILDSTFRNNDSREFDSRKITKVRVLVLEIFNKRWSKYFKGPERNLRVPAHAVFIPEIIFKSFPFNKAYFCIFISAYRTFLYIALYIYVDMKISLLLCDIYSALTWVETTTLILDI